MRVLILGASGIIGQHMREEIPPGILPMFTSRRKIAGFYSVDLTDAEDAAGFLREKRPDVVVNLAGESRPDVVESDPAATEHINTIVPAWLALWTLSNHARMVQVSTQAVFSGEAAPYGPQSPRYGINAYGRQKILAENAIRLPHVTLVRPTFVLGVRPLRSVGRANPIELMLAGGQRKQVCDRFFSVSFAPDVASTIWNAVQRPTRRIIHAGVPVRKSRYEIARDLGLDVEPVSHSEFPGMAPRPFDTQYAAGSDHLMSYEAGLQDCLRRYQQREAERAA